MNCNVWWDHSFQNSNSVPFNFWHVYTSSPKTSIAEASTSLSVEGLYLYMPCKRNFWGAVWKTCRHGSPQHQFMPPPYGAHKIHQVTKFGGEISDAREWLVVSYTPSAGLRGWCWAHAQHIHQVHMVSGSKQHMTALRPVHTAVFSVRQWQLKCH